MLHKLILLDMVLFHVHTAVNLGLPGVNVFNVNILNKSEIDTNKQRTHNVKNPTFSKIIRIIKAYSKIVKTVTSH